MRTIVLSLLLLLGCRGSYGFEDDVRVGDAGPSPRALACAALAEASCARLAACAPGAATIGVGTGATCTAALTEHCTRTAGLGGSARSTDEVSKCARAIPALDCPAFLTRYPELCEAPPGALVNGEVCSFDEQCATHTCARVADVACGTCAAARPPAARLGESCGPSAPCERLLFCDVNRCAPRKKVGEKCGGLGQCDPYEAAYCNETFECSQAEVARLGEPCSFTANALVLCEAPARCINDRCAPAKPEGSPCGAAGAHECAGFDAECIRGVCVRRTVETCAAQK